MRVVINVAEQEPGYKEAVETYVAKHAVRGMLLEYGIPSLVHYKTLERQQWRLRQVNPANVCCEVKAPVYDESANTFTFTLIPRGPRRDALEHLWATGMNVVINTRMVKNPKGGIARILAFDILSEDECKLMHAFAPLKNGTGVAA